VDPQQGLQPGDLVFFTTVSPGASHVGILIGGDEFGPLSGVPGSDAKMLLPEDRGAVAVSVGPEPAGAP
jgi:hypothetical protein